MKISLKKDYWNNQESTYWKEKLTTTSWLNSIPNILGIILTLNYNHKILSIVFLLFTINNTYRWISYNQHKKRINNG